MAVEKGVFDYTFNASVTMKAYQYHFVKAGVTDGNIIIVSSGNDQHTLGVLQNDPTASEEAVVRFLGITKMVFGEAVTTGELMTPKSNAHAESADAAGEPVLGITLSTHSSTGEIGTMFITHYTCHATSTE